MIAATKCCRSVDSRRTAAGRFSGVARDAECLAEHIKARVGLAPVDRQAALNEAAIGS
jgi:hypothetical protein